MDSRTTAAIEDLKGNLPQADLGPYRLEKCLGRGGMGTVYRAVDERLGRRVAIKHLPPAVASDETRRQRFRREAATLARLSHPAIVQIFDLIEAHDGDWIVMELVEGPTVAELVGRSPLPVTQILDVGRQVTEGLAEAHEHGILHRDLKAENVMLQRPAQASAGRIKILDFGIAKMLWGELDEPDLSTDGKILGTLRAMSPEQVRGLPLDARSDLFSFGLLLYQMTTGKAAFRGTSDVDTLLRITGYPHRSAIQCRPEIPLLLSQLIDRLLEKSPGDRPASAHEVAEELARVAALSTDGPEGKAAVISEALISETLTSEDHTFDRLPTTTEWKGRPPRSLSSALVLLPLVLLVGLVAVGLVTQAWRQVPLEVTKPLPTKAGPATEPDAHALFQQGMTWLERSDKPDHLERAINSFEGALIRDATSAAAHAGLALTYQEQYLSDRDPLRLQQALTVAERAVSLDEHLALARVALGTASSLAGRVDDAQREFTAALRLEPSNVEAYRGLGEFHRRQGRFDEAVAAYEHAVGLAPRDRALRDQLGRLYYRAARYEEAEGHILKSIELAPDRARGYRDLSAVYYMQGRLTEAAEELQKALAIRPDHSFYSNLGTIFFAQGLYPAAARAFEKALRHDGAHFPLYWANLADARRMMGDDEEAKADYGQAIELLRSELEKEPNRAFLKSRLALYLAKRGDRTEALAALAESGRFGESQPADFYRIAVAYEVCGERVEALTALDKALEAGYPMQEVRQDPELFELRSDPRFHRMIRSRR